MTSNYGFGRKWGKETMVSYSVLQALVYGDGKVMVACATPSGSVEFLMKLAQTFAMHGIELTDEMQDRLEIVNP